MIHIVSQILSIIVQVPVDVIHTKNNNRHMDWQIEMSQHIIHEPKKTKKWKYFILWNKKHSRNKLKPIPPPVLPDVSILT